MNGTFRIIWGKSGMALRKALTGRRLFLKRLITGNRKRWESFKVGGGKQFFSQDSSKYIVNSPLGEINVPEILFHDFIFQNWSLWEKKTSMECVKTGRKYTYRNVKIHCHALAAAFQNRLNLSKGDVVGMILSNCPEFPIVILAASLCGVITTTLNPAYTVDEIQRQLDDSKPKLLITDTKTYNNCILVGQKMKVSFPILVVLHSSDEEMPEGGINLIELFNSSVSGELKPVGVSFDDTLILPYSSGTTGRPKGVALSHRNIVSNLMQLSHPETTIIAPTTWLYQEKVFVILPMFHIFGMVVSTFLSLKEGCRLIILPSFHPKIFLENLYYKKINIVYVVPPILNLLSHKQVKGKYLKHVNYMLNGGSRLPYESVIAIMEKAEHVKVVQGYGLTETSPVLTHLSTKRMQKLTSIGIPIASTKLKIVDSETRQILPKGERGELCAWGPQVMKQYWNKPESTKNAFDDEGWFKTGDMAFYDDDGDFFIVQRLKELIKVKGFQVSPHEIEEVLRTHPKILDAAVVGIPDPDSGEVPKVFIIVREGVQMTEEEVKEFMKKKLAHYKQPRGGVRFVDNFPRNQLGKVLVLELLKMS